MKIAQNNRKMIELQSVLFKLLIKIVNNLIKFSNNNKYNKKMK